MHFLLQSLYAAINLINKVWRLVAAMQRQRKVEKLRENPTAFFNEHFDDGVQPRSDKTDTDSSPDR